MSREKSIATRCQLLVGSFDGASGLCPCKNSQSCQLTTDQRRYFADDESVLAAKSKNLKEYNDGKTDNAPEGGEE
jgi:hypothetical protein